MSLQTQISSEVKALYDFHDYEITKEKIIEIVNLMLYVKKDLTADETKAFCLKVKAGIYGTFFKSPSCLMSMFQEFKAAHPNIKMLHD